MGSCYLRLARGVVNWETLECGDMSLLSKRRHVRAVQNATKSTPVTTNSHE